MPLNDFVRDVQSNPQARIGFLFWITDAMEAIKNVVDVLFLNPNAKVLDAHHDCILRCS